MCLLCREPDLETLTPVTLEWLKGHGVDISRTLIEMHHLYGEAHDSELIVPLCLNCHRKVHEGLAQVCVSMKLEADSVARMAIMLDADAVFFEKFAESRRRMAEVLRKTLTPEDSND